MLSTREARHRNRPRVLPGAGHVGTLCLACTRIPKGRQMFSVNHIVCVNCPDTASHSYYLRKVVLFFFNQCRDLLKGSNSQTPPKSQPFEGQCSQATVLTLFTHVITAHEGGCIHAYTFAYLLARVWAYSHLCSPYMHTWV